jgi:hypothetical protein
VFHLSRLPRWSPQLGKIALRLRVPPPSSRTDAMRHDMARVLFFREDTVTPLRDVHYRFDSPAPRETAPICASEYLPEIGARPP